MKTFPPLFALCALFLCPLSSVAQDAQTITMKQRSVPMGQQWTVDHKTHFEVQNHVSSRGKVVELVVIKEKEGSYYKATAHTVLGGQITRLWLEFGDVFHNRTKNERPENRVSPLKKNKYMLQSFGTSTYVTDRSHEPATAKEGQSLRFIINNELGKRRHSFLPPLPKKTLKIGQTVPAGETYIQSLLGKIYRHKRSKLVLTGTKLFDRVPCAIFQLTFVAEAYFNNGVILEITGKGEVLTEIETSLNRSIKWSGKVKLGGDDGEQGQDKHSFRGLGTTSRTTVVSYLKPKKISPITIGSMVPEIGQRWDQRSKIESTRLRRQLDAAGELTEEEKIFKESKSFSLKVLKRSRNAVTKAEVKFNKFEVTRNSEAPDSQFKGLAHKLLTIERLDPKKRALKIESPPGFKLGYVVRKNVSRAVHSCFRPDRTDLLSLLPKEPIRAFTPIKIDPKKALKRLGGDFKGAKEIDIGMVFIDSQVIDERECAIFLISINVRSEKAKGVFSTFSESGEMMVEVKTGWLLSIRDSAFYHEEETISTAKGPLKITTFGPWKSTLHIRYGPRVKKGS